MNYFEYKLGFRYSKSGRNPGNISFRIFQLNLRFTINKKFITHYDIDITLLFNIYNNKYFKEGSITRYRFNVNSKQIYKLPLFIVMS